MKNQSDNKELIENIRKTMMLPTSIEHFIKTYEKLEILKEIFRKSRLLSKV
jgi:hypothetical protein